MLAWVSGSLPSGFADAVAALPDVRHVVTVFGSTAWLTLRPSRRTPIFSPPARRQAMRDFLRGRFGPPPEWLRTAGAA